MSTVLWDDVLHLITPEISTCPEATIKEYLPIVASDFFARTHLWRIDLSAFPTQINQEYYDICAPYFDAVVEAVQWIKVDDKKLTHTDERLVNPEYLDSTGQPTHFWVKNDSSIRLFYIPDQVWDITGEVILKPKRTARGIPSWVYETWIDTIVSGVLYRLCRIKDKDWTDPEFSKMHKNLYEQGVTNSRIRDMRGVKLQVRMQHF
jgi:hypothetical protein